MASDLTASVRITLDGKSFVGQVREAKKEVADLSGRIRDTGAAGESAGRGLQSLSTYIRTLGVAAAAYKALSFASDLVSVGMAAERTATQLRFATGSAEQGRTEYAFLRQTVEDLGLDLNVASGAFGKLAAAARGTALEGQGARDIFRAVAEASSVMGLSAGESEGALLAISQMISKGTVQAEELRGQLGERLPGAFQIAARAMGVTTAELGKMLETGQVLADDFLPRFATELRKAMADELPNATRTAQSEINRLSNAWTELKQAFAASGVLSTAASLAKSFAESIRDVTAAVREAQDDGALKSFWVGLGGVGAMLYGKNDRAQLDAIEKRIARRIEFMKDLPEAGRAGYTGAMSQDLVEAERLRARIADRERDLKREPPPPRTPPLDLDAMAAAGAGRFTQLTSGLRSKDEEYRERSRELWTAFAEADGRVERSNVDQALAQLRERVFGKSKAPEFLQRTGERIADVASQQLPEEDREVRKFLTQGRELGIPESTLNEYAQALRTVHEVERNRVITLEQTEAAQKAQIAAYEQQEELNYNVARVIAQQNQAAVQLRESFQEDVRHINVEMIQDDRTRVWAAFDEEKRIWQQRISALAVDAEMRKSVEDEYANWVTARHQQLTEQLKPEWQKMLDAWSDNTRLMRDAFDNFVLKGLQAGEDAWIEFAKTGKVNMRSLVDIIIAEQARLAYRQNIAPVVSKGLTAIGGMLFPGGGAKTPADMEDAAMGAAMHANSGGGGWGSMLTSAVSWIASLFHEGGMAYAPRMARAVDPSVFHGARRMHGGAGPRPPLLRSGEVPAILDSRESVFTPEQLRNLQPVGSGAGTVINYNQTVNVMAGANKTTANQAALQMRTQAEDVFARLGAR